jgi:uncharacterized phiE125 gp8 family phage protein
VQTVDTTTPPATEPIELGRLRAHCVIEHEGDDELLLVYLAAARESLEAEAGLAGMTTAFTWTRDRFPCDVALDLPRRPVAAVESIQYRDTSGTLQTLDPGSYRVEGNRVVLDESQGGWPSTSCRPGAVKVAFVAGYDDPELVPPMYAAAVLLLTAHLYANREAVAAVRLEEIPLGIRRLVTLAAGGPSYR